MKLIVGLGNPGIEYARTRHNAGFMALDRLILRHHISGEKTRFHSRMFEGQIAGQRCVLLQPLTFMNKSGVAVSEAATFFKISAKEDLLVVVDDVALPVGRIRVRPAGGAGGHNGLTNIQMLIGTQEYPRIRIGISAALPGRQVDHVLGAFTNDEMDLLKPALEKTCEATETWLAAGVTAAMNKFNAEPEEEKKKDGQGKPGPKAPPGV